MFRAHAGDPPFLHLGAAVLACGLFLVLNSAALAVGRRIVRDRIMLLATRTFTDKWRGEAVQAELFRHDAILPMYGSSELVMPMPNRADLFFAHEPSGFTVATVGDRGTPLMALVMNLASLGRAAAGRRLVLSISGTWFLGDRQFADRKEVVSHASALQTGDMLFRAGLPPDLRRRIARRVARIPEVADDQQLLTSALTCLADRCALEALLPALAPLWWIRALPMRVDDVVRSAWASRGGPPRPRAVARSLDWDALEYSSDSAWRMRSANNAFGVDAAVWARGAAKFLARRAVGRDSAFLANMSDAPRWDDFDLLLRTARAMDARPLVLTSPLKGPFWDFAGVSNAARAQFYRHVDSLTAVYAVPALSFSAYDGDRNFLMEPGSHLSEKGWLVYDHAIDSFHHDALR